MVLVIKKKITIYYLVEFSPLCFQRARAKDARNFAQEKMRNAVKLNHLTFLGANSFLIVSFVVSVWSDFCFPQQIVMKTLRTDFKSIHPLLR